VLRVVIRPVRGIGFVVISLTVILLLGACGSGTADSSAPDPEDATVQKAANGTTPSEVSKQGSASYVVPTITCPSCAARVEASASEEPGVRAVQVEGQDVTVTYDPDKTSPQRIAEAIRKGGDTVRPVSE
jgi:copper chaperone CopZ